MAKEGQLEPMANPWFRFYHEWDFDPKVQSMPEPMQRRLAMLFCSRCREEVLEDRVRAFHWRITEADLAETKALFIEKGFIDEKWNLIHWGERQFVSDSSKERTRRYREHLKNIDVTSPKRRSNVTVTAPYTDTDTDTDSEQIKKVPGPAASAAQALDDNGDPLSLPLINGSEWPVDAIGCLEWAKAFPAVNVLEELIKMRVWLTANPKNRKTPGGVRRFVVNWLGRAQDRSRPDGNGNGHGNRGQGRTDGNREALRRATASLIDEDVDGPGRSEAGKRKYGNS